MNERIRDVNEAFSLGPATYELVCECDSCGCMARVDVPRDVYEKVRVTPGRFLVVAGHEHDDRLVAGSGAYSVVVAVTEAEAAVSAAS